MVMILISWCGCSKRNCEYALVLEEWSCLAHAILWVDSIKTVSFPCCGQKREGMARRKEPNQRGKGR